jgi:RNA polymerase sigma-70 factor, ECF subfamily
MSVEELIRACAESNDSAVWNEFVSRYHRPIGLSILRTAHHWGVVSQPVVDDLVQETYLKLCANQCRLLRDFVSQHPEAVVGYIKTIAANVAHDHFRALHSQKRGSGEPAQSLEDFEPEAPSINSGGPDAMEREILLREINLCLETCSKGPDQERDRMIFWLYYQQGMSATAIADLPTVGLTPKGVESAIFRLTRMVREQIASRRSQPEASVQPDEKGFRAAESY